MKKIMLTGFDGGIDEQTIRQALDKVGPIHRIQIIRDGNTDSPVVIVEMAISDELAHKLTNRVTDYWYDGHMVNAHVLLH